MVNLETLKQQTADMEAKLKEMKAEIARLENGWEMKCPYENGDKHYCIQSDGEVFPDSWRGIESDNRYFSQGNIFQTEQAAKLEAKRRNLLTRFRAFRDECNGYWKADWSIDFPKYYLRRSYVTGELEANSIYVSESFLLFGYFKKRKDAERAIELFGEEIKELFVECE